MKQTVLFLKSSVANDNVTVPYGTTWLSGLVFEALGLNAFLDTMKRDQGIKVSVVVKALVSFAIMGRGLSVLNIEYILSDPAVRMMYGLPDDIDRNDLYRCIKRMGLERYCVIRHINSVLKRRFGVRFVRTYIDWSTSYIDGKSTAYIRFGHSKDHRPDRPQVSYGIALDADAAVPIGLTVERGNINDDIHFRRTFGVIERFLEPKASVTFDAGANGKVNTDMLNRRGYRFLTRVEINESDEKKLSSRDIEWTVLKDGTLAHRFEGNLGYTRTIFFSEKRKGEVIQSYWNKAERDYEKMLEMKKAIDLGHEPRKKYRSSNCFIATQFQLGGEYIGLSREAAIEAAVKNRITGREGYFVLLSNWEEDEQETLDRYRHRNLSEDMYKDLKTGIRIRPIRSKNWIAVRGRIMIAYLALLVISFTRFMVPELRGRTAETIVDGLRLFSVTRISREDGKFDLHYSNYSPMIKQIDEVFSSFPMYGKHV